jgi:hypothetical protein
MTHIVIWGEEHEVGEPHYHLRTDLGQKKVFVRFKERLLQLLPKGYQIKFYSSSDDIGILDARHRQHMHIYYIQRRFPHNLHMTFLRDSFKPIFTERLQKCFPKAEITWEEDKIEQGIQMLSASRFLKLR